MGTSLLVALDQLSNTVSEAIAGVLVSRRGAVFSAMPRREVERIVTRLLAAVRSDAEVGGSEHVRGALVHVIEDVKPRQLGFYDLRLLIQTVRKMLLEALDGVPNIVHSARRISGDLLSEMALQVSVVFIAQREEVIAQQAMELELRLADAQALYEEKVLLGERLGSLISSMPGMVWEGHQTPKHKFETSFVSDQAYALSGYTKEEWLADPDLWMQVVHPEDKALMVEQILAIMASGAGVVQSRWITKDGRTIYVEAHIVALRDEEGKAAGLRGVTVDVTAREEAEEEQAALREALIRLQEQQLAELSTPLIPINAEVLVMPLIGSIDRVRAERVLETLLSGISKARAKFAILDITGVPRVDAQTADALLAAARAVRLLGAEVVLTGICPEVAQTLVELGVNLGGIVTKGTLESGIAHATARGKRS